jgi:tRNA (cytidine56-2'-O)-methyltransferase
VATGSSGSKRKPRSDRGPEVELLRVGHRAGRDPRLTTHLALAARALGASRMYLHPPDPDLAARVDAVATRWGGDFRVLAAPDWKRLVRAYPGAVVHLTMYGRPLAAVLPSLRRESRLLLVVGGAKVPSELYRLAKYNVGVGHQPHSEVAAVAVTLSSLRGLPGTRAFPGARQRVVPQARGKQVATRGEDGRWRH